MNTKTGEIKSIEDIKREVPKDKLGEWSKPFYKGMQVNFSGVRAEIIKIKQARQEITLQYKISPRPLYLGMQVNFLSVPMEVIKIKQSRHEIILKFRKITTPTSATIDIDEIIKHGADDQVVVKHAGRPGY